MNSEYGIFLSYCWEDCTAVNRLDNLFLRFGIKITRDIRDLLPDDNIHDFMRTIQSHNKIILYVSDSYLRSINCMYECSKALEVPDKIIIIMKKGTKLFSISDKQELIEYWNQKKCEVLHLDSDQYQAEIADIEVACQSIAKFIDFSKSHYRMDDENIDFDVLLDKLQIKKVYPQVITKPVYAWIAQYPEVDLFSVQSLICDLYQSKYLEFSEFPNIPVNETVYLFKGIEFQPEKNGILLRLTIIDRYKGTEYAVFFSRLVGIEENTLRSNTHSKYYFYCENAAKKQRYIELQERTHYNIRNEKDEELLCFGYRDTYRIVIYL